MNNPAGMPSYFERLGDEELFVLANDGKYYIEKNLGQFPDNSHTGWSQEKLIECNFSIVHPTEFGPRAFFTVRLLPLK
jgi:hypothetical protein